MANALLPQGKMQTSLGRDRSLAGNPGIYISLNISYLPVMLFGAGFSGR